MESLSFFEGSSRIVLKIGSSLLVDPEMSTIRRPWLDALADDISQLAARGKHIIIVSSGAVALGRAALGATDDLESKQAAAAIGQVILAENYAKAFGAHDLTTAQALLTLNDTEDRRRWLNARATLNKLLSAGIIPIINENDTIATDEIRYGDNDRLAARTAQMVGADTLILLSDIDGLYSADPRHSPAARHIGTVRDITADIRDMASGPNSERAVGSGGMATKIMAADIAVRSGCKVVIMNGADESPLIRLSGGARHTVFEALETPILARQSWIAGQLKSSGTLEIDRGAQSALKSGKSLLPAGVTACRGNFTKGDAVDIKGPEGQLLARGLIRYSAQDAIKIAGRKSSEIETLIGYKGSDVLVHRDDMVMM